MKWLDFIADHNWFGKPTIIRKWQCNIFGHRHSDKLMITPGGRKCDMSTLIDKNKKWCCWCGRYV